MLFPLSAHRSRKITSFYPAKFLEHRFGIFDELSALEMDQPEHPGNEEAAPDLAIANPENPQNVAAQPPQGSTSRRISVFMLPVDEAPVTHERLENHMKPDLVFVLDETGSDLEEMILRGNSTLAFMRVETIRNYIESFRRAPEYKEVEPFPLPGVDRAALKSTLEFMVDENWEMGLMTDAHLVKVIKCAFALGYGKLYRCSANDFQQRVTIRNALKLYQLAKDAGLVNQARFVLGRIKLNPRQAFQDESLFGNRIRQDVLAEVLRADDVVFPKELEIFDIFTRIVSTITGKPAADLRPLNYKKHISGDLKKALRITRMTSGDLTENVMGYFMNEEMYGRAARFTTDGRKNPRNKNLRYSEIYDPGPRIPPRIVQKTVTIGMRDRQQDPAPLGGLQFLDSINVVLTIRADVTGLGSAAIALLLGGPKRNIVLQKEDSKMVAVLGNHDQVAHLAYGDYIITGHEVGRQERELVHGQNMVAVKVEEVEVDGVPQRRYSLEIGLEAATPLSETAETVGYLSRGSQKLTSWGGCVVANRTEPGEDLEVVMVLGGHQDGQVGEVEEDEDPEEHSVGNEEEPADDVPDVEEPQGLGDDEPQNDNGVAPEEDILMEYEAIFQEVQQEIQQEMEQEVAQEMDQ